MKIAEKLMSRRFCNMLVVFTCFLFFTSCNRNHSPLDFTLGEITNVKIAYQKWQGGNLSEYQIEQRIICFCAPPAGYWIKVNVKDNQVISAYDLESESAISTELFEYLYTIDEAFELIRNFEEQKPVKLEIQYDQQFGYPKRIDFDGRTGIADDEFILEIRELEKN